MAVKKEAVAAVLDKREHYRTAMKYYEGQVPEVFATARLRKAFATTGIHTNINFCRPIVNAVANRLQIGTVSASDSATAAIRTIRERNDLEFEETYLHNNACAAGDWYTMVWPDEEGEVQISFISPENATVVYDPMNHRKKLYGVQLWRSGESEHRLNILYPDRIEKYKTQSGMLTDALNWVPVETVENPFGEIPLFHFRTHMPQGRPEHYDAYDLQNNVNKLFVTNMNTIDYQGAPTRYALAMNGGDGGEIADFQEGETDRENMQSLKNGPGELWFLNNVQQVGEFKPADPDVFWKPIKEAVRTMSAITDTPLHYFDRTGNNPTGDGLRAAEAPLLKKIEERQRIFAYEWSKVYEFALKIMGIESRVAIYWKTIDAMDESEKWDVALKKINSGLSHRQALREGGYTEPEIEKIMAERAVEQTEGLYYQRAPQARVNVSNDETQAVQPGE